MSYKIKEFIRHLARNQVKFLRKGSGSHNIYKNEVNEKTDSVPDGKKEISRGTADSICKELGIPRFKK